MTNKAFQRLETSECILCPAKQFLMLCPISSLCEELADSLELQNTCLFVYLLFRFQKTFEHLHPNFSKNELPPSFVLVLICELIVCQCSTFAGNKLYSVKPVFGAYFEEYPRVFAACNRSVKQSGKDLKVAFGPYLGKDEKLYHLLLQGLISKTFPSRAT